MPPQPPNLDAFHKERGKLVDGFALVEASLVAAIVRANGTVKNDTLVGKLKTFKELKTGALNQEAADAAVTRVTELIPLRADIVHGAMATVDRDDRYAVFTNARYAASPVQQGSQMTLKTMRELAGELRTLAETIKKA